MDNQEVVGSQEDKDMKNKVVVAGASGLIGAAAIESFLAAGWDVIGISRRKPELPSGRDFRFISVDLRDEKAARESLSPLADLTHVAYAAIYENADDLVSGWSNADQIEANNAMLRHVIEPLVSGKSVLKHGACAAHTITWPTRSASAISQTNDGPPGKLNASPFSRRIAAYTPMAGRTFRAAGCFPGDELRT
jgi:NAD(P)-dependent dehydrogenase (short-subunit alcohol dehydrogenase family)